MIKVRDWTWKELVSIRRHNLALLDPNLPFRPKAPEKIIQEFEMAISRLITYYPPARRVGKTEGRKNEKGKRVV